MRYHCLLQVMSHRTNSPGSKMGQSRQFAIGRWDSTRGIFALRRDYGPKGSSPRDVSALYHRCTTRQKDSHHGRLWSEAIGHHLALTAIYQCDEVWRSIATTARNKPPFPSARSRLQAYTWGTEPGFAPFLPMRAKDTRRLAVRPASSSCPIPIDRRARLAAGVKFPAVSSCTASITCHSHTVNHRGDGNAQHVSRTCWKAHFRPYHTCQVNDSRKTPLPNS